MGVLCTCDWPGDAECPEHGAERRPARCPHGTVETATTKCRECIRERAQP